MRQPYSSGGNTANTAGGAIVCHTLIFAQLGLPDAALSDAVFICVVTDYYITAFDVTINQCVLAMSAAKLDLIDRSMLEKV